MRISNDFFSGDIFDLIVQESNIYSFQKFGKSINITSAELADFFAVQLWMGVNKLQRTQTIGQI